MTTESYHFPEDPRTRACNFCNHGFVAGVSGFDTERCQDCHGLGVVPLRDVPEAERTIEVVHAPGERTGWHRGYGAGDWAARITDVDEAFRIGVTVCFGPDPIRAWHAACAALMQIEVDEHRNETPGYFWCRLSMCSFDDPIPHGGYTTYSDAVVAAWRERHGE